MFTEDFWIFLVKLHEVWASNKTLIDLQTILSERMSLKRQAPGITAVEHCEAALKIAPVSSFVYKAGILDEAKAVVLENYRRWLENLKLFIKNGQVKCDQ